jgi:PAS domain S-box-containing protein
MKPVHIGIVVSTPSIDICLKSLESQPDTILTVSYHGLENAVPIGKKMVADGVEVLVSRRGTAYWLRENLQIPVLSFPQTSLNLFRSIQAAARKGGRIFLPSFREKRLHMEIFAELLGVEFSQNTYTDSASLRQIIAQAALDGFEVVVGGGTSMRFALEFGMRFSELVTSEEEMIETLENARSAAWAQREQKAMSIRYQSIVDASSDGIIAIDRKGKITTVNQTAQRLLGISGPEFQGRHISRLMTRTAVLQVLENRQPVLDAIEKIGGTLFVFNHLPILLRDEIIGVVSSFKEISHVLKAENKVRQTLSRGFVATYVIEDLIYQNPTMGRVVKFCREFARTASCILITGETGTGKEIVAQSIHNLSERRSRPFVSVHCAALTEQLLESELFGHEEGAFTGAKKGGKPGLFELAHQGTIFLDEIDSTTQNVQLRLLRVLQEKEVMRVGSDHKIKIDVRVIVAAGKDLWQAVREGGFRKDLFFRLNVLRIDIPPVRARKEDIPLLLHHFLDHYARKHQLPPLKLPEVYLARISGYSWPGNVRQIKHFAEQLLLTCNFECREDALENLFRQLQHIGDVMDEPGLEILEKPNPEKRIPGPGEPETEAVLSALKAARYSKTRAAELLGVSRTTLWRRLRKLGLG